MEDITIPEGYEAKIEGNKIVFVKKESYDEKIRKALIEVAREVAQEQFFINRGVTLKDVLTYLERQKPMYNLEIPAGDIAPAEEDGPFDEDEFLENELSAFLQNYDKEYKDDAAVSDVARHFYEIGKKQKEQKPKMIQWTGKNLKEVIDFTGKSPRFDEWFKSWEDFENYVHSHGDIFKLFCEDGSHYEVPVGAWIIKTPDGFNTPSHFRFIQKPAEWSKKDERIKQDIENLIYFALKDGSAVSYAANTTKEDALNWLKSLHPQPKQEWNEEDDKMCNAIVDYMHPMHLVFESTKWKINKEYTKEFIGKAANWLKSLPQRIVPQPGLSKEDFIKFGNLEYERGKQDGIQSAERVCWKPSELEKGAIRTAIHILIEERAFPKAAAQLQNILNAFEGKESRKDWKPSKEQLAALEHSYRACYRDDICSLDDGYQLRELYNKLIEIQ